MKKKIASVRPFYALHKGSGIHYAVRLYRDYLEITPSRSQVSLKYFVRWAPDWVKKEKERTSLGGGLWFRHTKLDLGDISCIERLRQRCLAHRK